MERGERGSEEAMTRPEAIDVLGKVLASWHVSADRRREAFDLAIDVLGDLAGQIPAARLATLERERADSFRTTKPILDAMRIWLRELKISRATGLRGDDTWPLEAAEDALRRAGEEWLKAETQAKQAEGGSTE